MSSALRLYMYCDISCIQLTEVRGGLMQHSQLRNVIDERFSWVPGESFRQNQIGTRMNATSIGSKKQVDARWTKRLEREFTDRKVRGSNPTSASRLPPSRFGQLGSIRALMLPSGNMAARRRMGVTAEPKKHGVKWGVLPVSDNTPQTSTQFCGPANAMRSVRESFASHFPHIIIMENRTNVHLEHPSGAKLSNDREIHSYANKPVVNYEYTCNAISQISQRLKNEAAWCRTLSWLETSQTRDSAGFQTNPDFSHLVIRVFGDPNARTRDIHDMEDVLTHKIECVLLDWISANGDSGAIWFTTSIKINARVFG
ncbi:hypothetical protein T265_07699 [Opisthorchis viverrini]|uniref:Uncharacterized protein n=1 Tax=Opisthorchis viverrini TaxID=6198 RepID=A0A074ZGC6_OPIVI|nr:hypothetical protein T265_07699 [Opisthorchis viverrini]KER24697.1 hypothetical protein T265_07699 [Opisthorchis viverrini]